MENSKMLTILVLALMLCPASTALGAVSLTVNGQDVTSITLEQGQSCTAKVVSDDGVSYIACLGFDNGVVLGDFSHLETKPEAGNLATAIEYEQPTFYGYYLSASGFSPAPSAGVHFTFEYIALQLGETDLKLYDETFTSVIDSVNITVIPLQPVAMGSVFTYQGRLNDAGSPAEGLYDFSFKLYDNRDLVFAAQQGAAIDVEDLDVVDGYFTVQLDFGDDPNIFNGTARWLEIGVRPGELEDPNTYTSLSPRQELTPTPYALHAKTVSAPLLLIADAPAGTAVIGAISTGDGVAIGAQSRNGDIGILGMSGAAVAGMAGSGGLAGRFDGDVEVRTGNIGVDGTVNAAAFTGDGSGLTNLPATVESDPTVLASVKDGVSWGEVSSRPAGLDDGDDVGITTETDPTVLASVKDGVSWSELSAIPAGFADGVDDIGGADSDWTISGYNMYSIPSGNVGIGTTSPAEKLEVDGTVKAAAFVGDGSGLMNLPIGYDSDWTIADSNMYSAVSGNVGIGTETPDAKLDVETAPEQGGAATIGSSLNSATGDHAVAMGDDTTAGGWASTAMGGETTASGDGSTAMGAATTAGGRYSTAMGLGATASNECSIAMGQNTIASGENSTAMGDCSIASGRGSIAIGYFTESSGYYSTAMGYVTDASGHYSTAMGRSTIAGGASSTAMGSNTTASAENSTAMGSNTTAGGIYSTAMGYYTDAGGYASTAMGRSTIAGGEYSTAMGRNTTASAENSTAMGYGTTTGGIASTAMGSGTNAGGSSSTAMGYNTTASGASSTAMGLYTDAIGTASTAMGNNSTASGTGSTAMGYYTTASGFFSTAMGRAIEAAGEYSVAIALADMGGAQVTQDNTMAIMGGYVGIGTTLPAAKLHISGTPGVDGIKFPDNTLQTTAGGGSASVPIGAVIDWWRPNSTFAVPEGYKICDGSVVNDAQSPFNDETLPNLRTRFIMGANTVDDIGQAGGSDYHTHTISGETGSTVVTMGAATKYEVASMVAATGAYATADHRHNTYSHIHADGSLSNSNRSHIPSYVGLLKIMRIR